LEAGWWISPGTPVSSTNETDCHDTCHVCFKLADWFQKRRLLNNFPIGSYVKTMSADGGHFEPILGSLNTILEVDHLRTIDDMLATISGHSFNIGPYGKYV
jgi:hypothetical protein